MATFLELLGDPNFQNLLAGVGAGLDPEGVGGALGKGTIAYNKALASQKAAKTTLERNAAGAVPSAIETPATPSALESLLETPAATALDAPRPKLSYSIKDPNVLATEVADLLTPPDQPGPTSVARDKAGQVNVKYTPSLIPANEIDSLLSDYLPPQTTMADLDTDYTQPRGSLRQLASLEPDIVASLGPASAEARAVEPVIPPAVATKLEAHSTKYGTDSNLVKAIALQESGGVHTNPDGSVKVSTKGARGTMQLMPGTARRLNVNPDDPEQNLDGGVREVANLQKLSSNPKDILAGYVGGEGGMRLYQSQNATTPEQKVTLRDINNYVNATYARYERQLALQGKSVPAQVAGTTPTGIPLVDKVIDRGKQLITDLTTPGTQADRDAATARRRERERAAGGNKTDPVVPTLPSVLSPGTAEASPAPAKPAVKTQAEQVADLLNLPMSTEMPKGSPQSPLAESIAIPIEKESPAAPKPAPAPQVTALAPRAVRENYDLRGLSPDEVDKVVGRAIEAERADIARSVDKRENTQLIESEDGYLILNKRTREITPLTREGKIDAAKQLEIDRYNRLSGFSREVSAVPGTDPIVRGRMNESQSKSFKFGSRALQANEKQRRLEQRNADDPTKFADERSYMLQTLESLPADVSMSVVGQILTAGNALVGAAKDAYNNWLSKNPNATEGEIVSFLTTAGLGASEARAQAILATRRVLSADQREYLQNSVEFATAMLRDESGAAINAGEFLSTYRQYFPMVGDTTRDLLRKMRTRQQAIRGFRSSAGRPLLPPDLGD